MSKAITTINAATAARQFLNVSDGNKKLVSNAETRFIVWNLPARITCPFATDMCKIACYAVKAEYAYPSVKPSRQRNFDAARNPAFSDNMTYTIQKIAAGTKKRHIIVRIHESGDFFNQEYANAWLNVMRNCAGDKRIKFIAYTKSFKYFDGKKLPKNFSLRASVWADTAPDQLETIRRNGWNIYTAVEQFQPGDKFTRCRCKDCATCKKCWQGYKDIRCEIH